jgi:hypothetical protein
LARLDAGNVTLNLTRVTIIEIVGSEKRVFAVTIEEDGAEQTFANYPDGNKEILELSEEAQPLLAALIEQLRSDRDGN